jgi:hypothetical protein
MLKFGYWVLFDYWCLVIGDLYIVLFNALVLIEAKDR